MASRLPSSATFLDNLQLGNIGAQKVPVRESPSTSTSISTERCVGLDILSMILCSVGVDDMFQVDVDGEGQKEFRFTAHRSVRSSVADETGPLIILIFH